MHIRRYSPLCGPSFKFWPWAKKCLLFVCVFFVCFWPIFVSSIYPGELANHKKNLCIKKYYYCNHMQVQPNEKHNIFLIYNFI